MVYSTTKNSSKATVSTRMKDLRLKGADLYVARLGNEIDCKHNNSPSSDLPESSPHVCLDKLPGPPTSRSLHVELLHPTPSHSSLPCKISFSASILQIRASRLCYRCIKPMHAEGIKQVSWTNAQGTWDGAKVRDLADAPETSSNDGNGNCGTSLGVFVTKHEVLMLKRALEC